MSSTTDVLGYSNKQTYPIQISSDQLGVNIQVPPRTPGRPTPYVVDRAGRKINDPRLDHYATSGLLAKEFSPVPVPLVLLAGSPPAPAAPNTSVTGTVGGPVKGIIPIGAPRAEPDPTPTLRTRLPEAPAPSKAQPHVGTSSIHAMSITEAMKSGLIPAPDRQDHFARLPNEDQTGEAARSAPRLDSVLPPNRTVVPPALAEGLKTVDTSGLNELEEDPFKVTPLTPPPGDPPLTITAVRAMPKTVAFDGHKFLTVGQLKKHLLAKFNGDEDLAEEALEPFADKFG